MKSTPPIMNWISRAPSNSSASPGRSSLEVLNVKSTPALRSASARAASSSSVRYTTSLAPARASATIALPFSLSSKATTPRQYTVADLERARDRVEAAERRIDHDHTSNPDRGRAGLERAQLELHVIESQLRSRGLLEC